MSISSSGEYRTKQRAAVLSWLRRHPHAHVSAGELRDALSAEGYIISRSTIYRTLDRLCEDGSVRRFTLSQDDSTCYQYAGEGEDSLLCHAHFHLKCTVCGTLYHIECDKLDELSAHIAGRHGFAVDPAKTVILGVCTPCQRALGPRMKKK